MQRTLLLRSVILSLVIVLIVLSTTPVLASESEDKPTLTRSNLDEFIAKATNAFEEPSLLMTRRPLGDLAVLIQEDVEARRRRGLHKIIGGVALTGVGVLLAATSGESATATFGGNEVFEASSRSTGKLIAGGALAGGGVWLIISGSKDRR